jgi:hypothetical protein
VVPGEALSTLDLLLQQLLFCCAAARPVTYVTSLAEFVLGESDMIYARNGAWSIRDFIGLPLFLLSALLPLRDASAQALPICSWPFEVTGQGITNVATPDTNATYWVMPLDTSRWPAMIIQGQYPQARFFNFTTYVATGAPVASIIDADIAPDQGNTNPFASPADNEPHNYTVTVSGGNWTKPAPDRRQPAGVHRVSRLCR